MTVTWSTQLLANKSYVEYHIWNEKVNYTANATVSKFIDGSSAHRAEYMYRAVMINLTMNTSYSKLRFGFFCLI